MAKLEIAALILLCAALLEVRAVESQYVSSEEPSYEGRPLSAWVDELTALSFAKLLHTNRTEVRAVRAVGTNGIPWLLDEMGKGSLASGAVEHAIHQLRARAGFWALGEIGAPAVPKLLELLDEEPEHVASALAGIGSPGLTALQSCITNAPHFVPPYLVSKVPKERAMTSALSSLFFALRAGRISRSDALFMLPAVKVWVDDTNCDAARWAESVISELESGH